MDNSFPYAWHAVTPFFLLSYFAPKGRSAVFAEIRLIKKKERKTDVKYSSGCNKLNSQDNVPSS